jgi:hypothetical protein
MLDPAAICDSKNTWDWLIHRASSLSWDNTKLLQFIWLTGKGLCKSQLMSVDYKISLCGDTLQRTLIYRKGFDTNHNWWLDVKTVFQDQPPALDRGLYLGFIEHTLWNGCGSYGALIHRKKNTAIDVGLRYVGELAYNQLLVNLQSI